MRAFLLLTAALSVLGLAGPAGAHFDPGDQYTHKGCPATASNRADPINVVFTQWGTWGRAVSQIESHTWWTVTSGSSQSFGDHESCYPMHAQRASGAASRFHVRLRGQHPDASLGWTATTRPRTGGRSSSSSTR